MTASAVYSVNGEQFAGLIYFHLLLRGLEHSGKLPADASWATDSHPGVMAHHG